MTTPPLASTAPTELVVLDMAGTTVLDDGVVEKAFERAAQQVELDLSWDEALGYVRRTMGQSKIDVFTHLTGGDQVRAEQATDAFEAAYADIISTEGADEIPGAREALDALRGAGLAVILTTGFAPVTRDALIAKLGWHDLVDTALSPVDAGRGRPAPDLVLTAALRARVSRMAAVVVVGDTRSDVGSGIAAGAGTVVGVLSGAHARESLTDAGAHAVIDSVAQLPALLGIR